ncbi:MAG TPA: histidine kinase dimerization/phospho-acceptor domain-containing protein, partial [Candidatus Acidoferrum sp.]|nr:histidine kinase dimerization/phospho-acceptor domain-containing protein [Candidatus Acidoferrum sp.]
MRWQTAKPPNLWVFGIGSGIALFVVVMTALFFVRRYFRNARNAHKEEEPQEARPQTPSAFMAASMQGVIQKLRDQEKELERLHRSEKERAEHTERLSEEVTRNMPAGLLVVNANGIISSANPAAEQALGIHGLGFRRYSEALREGSELTRLVAECLSEGKIFRREQVEHATPAGERRHLGVTISPIRKGQEKISGALCLLSDLTELSALQQQMQLKENLAALGELSAGIAHEFKNALATISGYAQMIRSETKPGTELREHGEKILDQTRALAHVVTEFLKFARPLDLADEQVTLRPLIDRILMEVSEVVPEVPFTCEGEFGDVSGDDALLRQAILNLARNAAEAAADNPGGGRVIIRGEIEQTGAMQGQRISVSDNGPGIPAEALT